MEKKTFFWYKVTSFSLLLVFVSWILQIILANLLIFFIPGIKVSAINPEFVTVISWGGMIYTTLLSFIFMFRLERLKLDESWLISKKWKIFVETILGITIVLVYISVYYVLLLKFKYIEIEFRRPQKILTTILFAVFTGIAEEIPSRGYLLNLFSRNNKNITGIIFTSILFALWHVLNPQITGLMLINIFLIGVLLSLITLNSKSIYFAIAIHVSYNLLGIFLTGFGPLLEENSFSYFNIEVLKPVTLITGGENGITGSLILTGLLLLSIFISIILVEKREIKEREE